MILKENPTTRNRTNDPGGSVVVVDVVVGVVIAKDVCMSQFVKQYFVVEIS